ncbi:MAG: flagellar biosynthesis protein FlgN [Fervidobacterium sp.]
MIKENLRNEIKILESMIQAFKGLEVSVVNKDIQMLSKYAVNIEELSLELMKVESEREKILRNYQVTTVKEYIERYEAPDAQSSELTFLSAEIVEKLNELAVVMDGIRQIIEFDSQYVEFLNNLAHGVQSTTYDFSKNNALYHNTYSQIQSLPMYDRFK